MAEEATTTTATDTTQADTKTAETLLRSEAGTDETTNSTGTKETPDAAKTEPAKTEPKDAPAKTGAPEAYEFKAPEGVTFDTAAIEAFTPIAKELNLTNEQAQKLVDLHATQVAAAGKAQADLWAQQQQDWAAEFKADKEFGGLKAEGNIRAANVALGKFATPAERQEIARFGLSNFPAFVKILARAGASMQEDKRAAGGTTTDLKTNAEVFYGTK